MSLWIRNSLLLLLKRTSTSYIWESTLGMQGTPWTTSTALRLKDRNGSVRTVSNSAPTTSRTTATLTTVMPVVSDTASQAGGSAGNRYFNSCAN